MSAYDWEVGDRVQTDKNNVFRVGAVSAVEKHQVERVKRDWPSYNEVKYLETEIKSINIKWDDGEEQTGLGKYDVYQEDSDIERSFRLALDSAQKRIDEKMDEAWRAVKAAMDISEETGIPFSASVSPLSQTYRPASMREKFPGIDHDFVSDVSGAWGGEEGWQHSAVC